jgi:predicted nucleic acid-binding protein
LDGDDSNHNKAVKTWSTLLAGDKRLVTGNYIIVESFALIQNRIGLDAARDFKDSILPLVSVRWVDERIHDAATGAFFAASRRKLSLVDCASFEIMRAFGIEEFFAFDPHFAEQGFRFVS